MNTKGMRQRLDARGFNNINVAVYNEPILPSIALASTGHPDMGHWVFIEKIGNDIMIFDSYGTPPGDLYYIPNFDTANAKWSTITGQRIGTPYCGLYCIAFIVLRQYLSWPAAVASLFPERGTARDNTARLKQILGEDPDRILSDNGYNNTAT